MGGVFGGICFFLRGGVRGKCFSHGCLWCVGVI